MINTRVMCVILFSLFVSACAVDNRGFGGCGPEIHELEGLPIYTITVTSNRFKTLNDGDRWPRGKGELTSIQCVITATTRSTQQERGCVYWSGWGQLFDPSRTVMTASEGIIPLPIDDSEPTIVHVSGGVVRRSAWVRARPFSEIKIKWTYLEEDPRFISDKGWFEVKFTIPTDAYNAPEIGCDDSNWRFRISTDANGNFALDGLGDVEVSSGYEGSNGPVLQPLDGTICINYLGR